MAAAGTGLPTAGGGGPTALVDTASYGAAERAAAEGFQLAAQGFDRLAQTLRPAADESARQQAEQAVLAENFETRTVITSSDAAYNDALERGTLARLDNDMAADEGERRARFILDPEGYAADAAAYRSAALGEAGPVPGALAIQWAQSFDARTTSALNTIRAARAQADLVEAKGNYVAQNTRLIDESVSAMAGAPLAEAWEDPRVQATLVNVMRNVDALEANPAFGVSAEEADGMRREAIGKIKAGAARSYAVDVLREQGAPAAFAAIQEMMTTDGAFETTAERDMVITEARAAVSDEINLENQRRNQVEAERSAREQAGLRAIEEDIARFALTGEGSGLTEEQVREAGGDDFVLRWRRGKANAADQRRLYENLPSDPDEAAIEIARRVAAQGFESLPIVTDNADLDTIVATITQIESNGRDGLVSADPDGAGPAGGGAYGRMQVLLDTARRIAAKLGLPFDANRLRTDAAYNTTIGRAYLTELLDRYSGDTFLAVAAYHAGEGNVDGWLRSVGDPRSGQISRDDWLNGVEARGNPRSAEYPRRFLRALQAGRGSAAWNMARRQQAATLADPAAAVANEPDVRNALSLMVRARASGQGLEGAGEALVQANLAAQERRGISSSQRRALPMQQLVTWAGYLARNEADPRAFEAATDVIMSTFGDDAGARVLRDALIVRGNSAYAAEVAAAATRSARAGTPPPPPAAVAGARRVETINRAASGTAARDVQNASVEELRRAAGLSE